MTEIHCSNETCRAVAEVDERSFPGGLRLLDWRKVLTQYGMEWFCPRCWRDLVD